MDKERGHFVWNSEKEITNIEKHGVSFDEAIEVFRDKHRKIIVDERHSQTEERYFCIGKVEDRLLTVRFTYRRGRIRIIGAGCWRMGGLHYYEKES